MRAVFLVGLIAGLVLGVISMIAGIDRNQRRGTWVRFVNLPIIAAAATLFGLVGYPIAKYTSAGTAGSVVIAAVVAIAGAAGMLALIAGWAVPSARREVVDERYALQGHLAQVTRPILTDAPGEIAYVVEGANHRSSARSLDGKRIGEGADVVIERVEGGVAYVELWSTIERQLELPPS